MPTKASFKKWGTAALISVAVMAVVHRVPSIRGFVLGS